MHFIATLNLALLLGHPIEEGISAVRATNVVFIQKFTNFSVVLISYNTRMSGWTPGCTDVQFETIIRIRVLVLPVVQRTNNKGTHL